MSDKTYFVTLMITLNEDEQRYGHPESWDWATLLDLPWSDVVLEDIKEVD